MIFRLDKINGQAIFEDRKKFDAYVARFKDGTRWTCDIKKWSEKRTNPQNSYLHGIFRWIGNELGMEESEVKYQYKQKYLSYPDPVTGLMRVKKTSGLDIEETMGFIKLINQHCISFHGTSIPTAKEIEEALLEQARRG